MASSSSLSCTLKYDLFPSFCGRDVRKNFLSHLLEKFKSKGITSFIDDEIDRGEPIGAELELGIRQSKVAVVVLSTNYASSSWCLDELVEIMKCRKRDQQKVLTIFYGVDTSDVRKQTGVFGDAFKETCKDKTEEKVEAWRQALKDVANIAGYDAGRCENEAVMINKIAEDITDVLGFTPSKDFDDHVGMGSRIAEIKSLLSLHSDSVKMLAIVGPAGIGKTSTARALYEQLSHGFDFSTFIEDIRGSNASPLDSYQLRLDHQKKLLSEILKQTDIEVRHLGRAKEKLGDKKVLVVLDEVDWLWQLEAMANQPDWFGPGSTIIITTEDRKLLKQHKINLIYEMEFPTRKESLQIFCQYAFGQKSPYDGFHRLAREVTHLAGDLPLALKVMGSYLRGMPRDEWVDALPRLKSSLDRGISTLRFSYNVLSNKDKAIFLHIACFFVGFEVDSCKRCLANSDLDVNHGLQILEQKSLIYTEYGSLRMHRLLQQMGQEIVKEQSWDEPRKRQFLMDTEDISHLLEGDTGTGKVLGIKLETPNWWKDDKIQISESAFKGMNNLQFLFLDSSNVRIPEEGLTCLPDKLRLINWTFCPLRFWPSKFSGKFLVDLLMHKSKFERLWEGIKPPLQCLKRMNLSDSEYLKEIPDLTNATSLEVLDLRGCKSLLKLTSSIGKATKLTKFTLGGGILELPSSIGMLINLKELTLSHCGDLKELPSSIGKLINLEELLLSGCGGLKELPSSIGQLINLKELTLFWCEGLKELPSSIGKLIDLKKLSLYRCQGLKKLPSSIDQLISLKELSLGVCMGLKELPSSIGMLTNLEELRLYGCTGLKLRGCSDLEKLRGCSSLKTLDLSYTLIEEVPSSFSSNWSCLYELDMSCCLKLKEFPNVPHSLLSINAENCEYLKRIDSSFHNPKICLNFAGCLNLNQKARKLIQTSNCKYAILPGEEVPAHFPHQATSGSLTINLTPRPLPSPFRFKACILLSKGDSSEKQNLMMGGLSCSVSGKHNGLTIQYGSKQPHMRCKYEGSDDHLYIFEDSFCLNQDCPEAEEATLNELVFEFIGNGRIWKVKGCGVRLLVPHGIIDGNADHGDNDNDTDEDESDDDGDNDGEEADEDEIDDDGEGSDCLNLNQIARNLMVDDANDDEGGEDEENADGDDDNDGGDGDNDDVEGGIEEDVDETQEGKESGRDEDAETRSRKRMRLSLV